MDCPTSPAPSPRLTREPPADQPAMPPLPAHPDPSLADEILSHLGVTEKTAAWGTLGTVRPFLGFSVDSDVQRLLGAIAGQGVDQGTIVDVLTNRTTEQRLRVAQTFQDRTRQDLLRSLEAALSGSLEKAVVALLKPSAQFDAHELRAALKAPGTARDTAVEILATRPLPRLRQCLAFYEHDFQVEAAEDVRSEVASPLRELLLALAEGGRESYSGVIDYNLMRQDAQELHENEQLDPDGGWIHLFTQRSIEHLNRVFDQYKGLSGQEVEDTIRDRFQGDAQVTLLSLASVIRNTPLYFANKLHQALQGPEPDHGVLSRVLISRCETDLLSVRAEFRKKFGKSLYSSLQESVSGACLPALLGLCGGEDF
ncbi:annexin A9 [Ornithorhynchus anatinus]|nr:annexin A9 [Ornithorhynchus anatinus]